MSYLGQSEDEFESDQFAAFARLLPAGSFAFRRGGSAKGEPDFMFGKRGRRIGLEITRFFSQDDSLRKREGAWEGVMTEAYHEYRGLGGSPVKVAVRWNGDPPTSALERRALARQLAELVARHSPTEPTGFILRAHKDLPSGVEAIYLEWSPVDRGRNWWNGNDTHVELTTPAALQSVLDRKERKWLRYQTTCDAVWLLIAADAHFASTWVEVSETLLSHSYRSSFGRAFLLCHVPDRLYELRLVPATPEVPA